MKKGSKVELKESAGVYPAGSVGTYHSDRFGTGEAVLKMSNVPNLDNFLATEQCWIMCKLTVSKDSLIIL